MANWKISENSFRDMQNALSTIRSKLSVSLQEVENELNRQVPSVLFDRSGIKKGSIDLALRVTKLPGLQVAAVAGTNQIEISLPVRVWARADWRAKAIFTIKHHETTEFDITIKSRISITADEDWKVIAQAESSWNWDKRPYVKVGPIKVRISGEVAPVINKYVGKLSDTLESKLSDGLDLRKKLSSLWRGIPTVSKVLADPDVWLTLQPKQLFTSNLYTASNMLALDVGVDAEIKLDVLGEPSVPDADPLPENSGAPDGSEIQLRIPIELEYADALEALREMFSNRTFGSAELDGLQIDSLATQELNIRFSNGEVGISVDVTASKGETKFTGVIDLTTEPRWDEQEIMLQPVYLDNFWDKAPREVVDAGRLLSRHLREQLNETLTFDFAAKASMLRDDIQKSVDALELQDVVVDWNITTFEIVDVDVDLTQIRALVSLDGNAQLTLAID